MPIELRVSADLHTLADLAAQYPRLGRELADTVSRLHVFLPGGSLTTFEDFDGQLTAAGATHISAEVTDRYWREQTWRLPDEAIEVGDFFCFDPAGHYDVVIGNPPYIRYQDFSGESRARSRAAALRAGVPLTNLASSWPSMSWLS